MDKSEDVVPEPEQNPFTPSPLQAVRHDQAKRDLERSVFVIQTDQRGRVSVTEFDCHASQTEIAQALCDSNLPDCTVLHVLEGHVGDMLRDVTEDLAREIAEIAENATQDRWKIQDCAAQLLHRFDLFDPCEHNSTVTYLSETIES